MKLFFRKKHQYDKKCLFGKSHLKNVGIMRIYILWWCVSYKKHT